MKLVSDRFRAASNVSRGHRTRIAITPPGGQSTTVDYSGCTVSATLGFGVRRTTNATVLPQPGGIDLYALCSTPGAIFDIDFGIDFGGGDVEWLDLFYGEAATAGVNIIGRDISLSLVDMWQRIESARFTNPRTVQPATRAAIIAALVVEAVPGTTVHTFATGGSITKAVTWDRSRSEAIKDMATDGNLDVYFDTDGSFVIRDQPVLAPKAPVWQFRTGETGNLIEASRAMTFDRRYNQVVVLPADDKQTWARQIVTISDPNHPRYPGKIGARPFFYSSPTVTTAAAGAKVGNTILQRLQVDTETIDITALGIFATEPGDTVSVLKAATSTDPELALSEILTGTTFDCVTGGMTGTAKSDTIAEIEEAA